MHVKRVSLRASVPWMVAAGLVVVPAMRAPADPQKVPAGVPPAFARLLTGSLQFSASDVGSLARGGTVSRTLASDESREVAIAGAIWCNVPLEYFLGRARDIVTFKRSDEVQQIGVFGPEASAAELAGLTLDAQDVEDLRKCVPGQCKVRLDLKAIERFHYQVGWSAPDAVAQANRLAREVLAGYVAAYERSGNAGLIEYDDRDTPVSVATGAATLLDRSAWLAAAAPGLREYLEAYPGATSPDAASVLYWSKEAFGMKPVISATHMVVWQASGGAADATILSKQIFATHYLDASLGITLLAGDRRPDRTGVFVVYVNRSLVDLLQGGLLGPFRRSVARSKSKDGLADHLEAVRRRVEADFKAGT